MAARPVLPGGTLLGAFQVNGYSTYGQDRPRIAVDDAGDFLVVWESEGSDDPSEDLDLDGRSVQARRIDSSGVPVAGDLQVNGSTAGNQLKPEVAYSEGAGVFVVTWSSYGPVSIDAPRVRAVSRDGARAGEEVEVGSPGSRPIVAAGPGRRALVVWRSSDLVGRVFEILDAEEIFADGFESGDASQWSGEGAGR